MRHLTSRVRHFATTLAVVAALVSPLSASAQSDLDVSEAAAFIGDWRVPIESEFGPFTLAIDLEDQGGKVAASVGITEMGGMQDVSDVARSGEGLTLTWEMDAQGQYVEAVLILGLEGDNLSTLLSVADGQFTVSGVGTRAES